MKIKLSKSQWEEAGKKAGWIKTAQEVEDRHCKKCKKTMGPLSFDAWKGKDGICDKCSNRSEDKAEPKA